MSKYIENGVEYIGINQIMPKEKSFFGEIPINDIIILNEGNGKLKNIISVIGDSNILTSTIINTIYGKSNDGSKLLGKKLVVDGEYSFRIQYLTDLGGSTVFIKQLKYLKLGDIVIPQKINEKSVDDLFRKEKLKITSSIENISVDVLEKNKVSVYINIILMMQASNEIYE